ncbi:hypothetical protein T09_12206 [Trichinella sp. T9]|nr:hypothetical protein T09_12206 [Trichinella sp. T9]
MARTRAGPIQSRTFLSESRNTDVLPWSACDLRTPQLSVFPSLWLSTPPKPSPLTSTSTVYWRWNSGSARMGADVRWPFSASKED